VFKRRHQSAGSRAKSIDDLFFTVRKASQGLLAEYKLIIEPDLENSSPSLDESRSAVESFFYCGRQTDGAWLVVSLHAVFDTDLHRQISLLYD
jgi:hypothetical protein|tara:strand:- start:114 stop:392 length:279 start_codon:yes stop_codon:yes gene_type:complete